jgi:hypothetical protein
MEEGAIAIRVVEGEVKLPAPVCRQEGTGRGFREM